MKFLCVEKKMGDWCKAGKVQVIKLNCKVQCEDGAGLFLLLVMLKFIEMSKGQIVGRGIKIVTWEIKTCNLLKGEGGVQK